MTVLVGLFAFYIVSSVLGRIVRREHVVTYLVLILMAAIQVGIAVAAMFRMEPPKL